MGKKKKDVKVAYVLEDIHDPMFDIRKGAVFVVEDVKKGLLKGFHHGGTESIKQLWTWPGWVFDKKLLLCDVPEECHVCKYCRYGDDGWRCGVYRCVPEEDKP